MDPLYEQPWVPDPMVLQYQCKPQKATQGALEVCVNCVELPLPFEAATGQMKLLSVPR